MNSKINIHSLQSTAFSIHEIAGRLKAEGYDPKRLTNKTSIQLKADFDKNTISVIMRVRYVYNESEEEQEVMQHTCNMTFNVYDGFNDHFKKTAKGFSVSRDTFTGLIRFFVASTIGANRGMMAVRAMGSIIENHPYKFLNIDKLMDFVEKSNKHIQIAGNQKAQTTRTKKR
ncbi:MAG: hypothetical protein IM638_06790 [Bacteroidetes bacterium]|nr:hypothetical protein [Bacteroidota bacterium]